MIWARCVSRSRCATVMLAPPKTWVQSAKPRLVVMTTETPQDDFDEDRNGALANRICPPHPERIVLKVGQADPLLVALDFGDKQSLGQKNSSNIPPENSITIPKIILRVSRI